MTPLNARHLDAVWTRHESEKVEHRHVALREGARLVRTNHTASTQGLDGPQLPDKGTALLNVCRGALQAQHADGDQHLRDHPHARQQRQVHRGHPGASVPVLMRAARRSRVLVPGRNTHVHADHERRQAEQEHLAAQVVQGPLHRAAQDAGGLRRIATGLLDPRHDLPHPCRHARGHHDAGAPATRHVRGGVKHVAGGLPDDGLFFALRGLAHLRGLARQHRLVDLQIHGLRDAQVRRHSVAGSELDDISGHQLWNWNVNPTSVPEACRGRRLLLLHRCGGLGGTALAKGCQHRGENYDEHEDAGVHDFPENAGQEGSGEQQNIRKAEQRIEKELAAILGVS
mmetsp:Transcript_67100/g.218443  ORF Transcript_67100/g.218443 Transcript_67100/m.218443 type:complete len:342 (+) Transcript_67100:320-1345(+)